MSNLLKDASILLTPTAYDNGRMLAGKPSENLYGAELVTNGDFATDSDWTKATGATISGGLLNLSGVVGGQNTYQPAPIVTGKKYKITFTISNYVQGGIKPIIGSLGGLTPVSSNGTFTQYGIASGNSTIYLQADGTTTLSIDNVSVKEDLSGDFQFSRNSAATRVNAQGLVENVQILSSNLVSNGDFSQEGVQEVSNGSFSQEGAEEISNGSFDTDTKWTTNTGWSISDGSANCDGTQSANATLVQLVKHTRLILI